MGRRYRRRRSYPLPHLHGLTASISAPASVKPSGNVFRVGENVSELDGHAAAGNLCALAEGGGHASSGPSLDFLGVVLLKGLLGEDDMREWGLKDLDYLGAVVQVSAHTPFIPTPNFCYRRARIR